MKKFYPILIAFILVVPAALAAKENALKPGIVLNHLHTVQAGEKGGDELYFDVTVMRADKPREFFRIPRKPLHWQSSLTDKIKEVTLWSDSLNSSETVILMIALMEQDTTAVNPDDLIGLIRVELQNDNGTLQSQWTIPNRASGAVTVAGQKGDIQKFELYGPHGQYEVYLSLKK